MSKRRLRAWAVAATAMAWISACALVLDVTGPEVFVIGVLLLILAFMGQRFWRSYVVNRSFRDERLYAMAWVVSGLVAVCVAMGFRSMVAGLEYEGRMVMPPWGLFMASFEWVIVFLVGGWSWELNFYRVWMLLACGLAVWCMQLREWSKTNWQMKAMMDAVWKNERCKMVADEEKRKFGRHRRVFEDN